jgi:2-oxoglutarate dehydrogenase complex dehydrogenase (E1) component-like enzyme
MKNPDVIYCGRKSTAVTAVGSTKVHKEELKSLLEKINSF